MWETRGTLTRFVLDSGRGGSGRSAAINLALAFAPAAVAGLAFHEWIERELFSPKAVGWGLVVGAFGILLVERFAPRPRVRDVAGVSWRTALGVGLAQCLSLIPGMSRSAMTILGGMVLGLERRVATQFSFLVAIPTMLAAGFYSLYKARHILEAADLPVFTVGFVVSFVAGLATVKFLLHWVSNHDLRPFAWYRFLLGAAVWLYPGL